MERSVFEAGTSRSDTGANRSELQLRFPPTRRATANVPQRRSRACPARRTLEFAGRVDLQTKIAGARVEPEEIEAHLRRHPGIGDCAVGVREDAVGEARLVGYLVAAGGRVSDEELRTHLRRLLPAYMVPGVFLWLDRLPLTASNKVDRRGLPALPQDLQHALCTPPRDDLERRLVAMWEDLLGRRPIGIADDFFALGGHSLLAVRLFDRIRREYGLRLPLSVLLEGATVEQLATSIRTDVVGVTVSSS